MNRAEVTPMATRPFEVGGIRFAAKLWNPGGGLDCICSISTERDKHSILALYLLTACEDGLYRISRADRDLGIASDSLSRSLDHCIEHFRHTAGGGAR